MDTTDEKVVAEAYQRFMEEARGEPVRFIKHDTNAHDDDGLYRMVEHEGIAYYGWYWLLVELLTGRRGHTYDVSDYVGWRRFAHDMGCMTPITVEECKGFVESLLTYGLISAEHYEIGKVAILRILRDAETYAEGVADKKIGAWKTNRKRRGN